VTPPGDADALVSALLRLADDGDLRRTLGERARKYAVQHLDREMILTGFECSLFEVCGQSPARINFSLPKGKAGKSPALQGDVKASCKPGS
jgi:hypothetical protein